MIITVDLKNALRERPRASATTSPTHFSNGRAITQLPKPVYYPQRSIAQPRQKRLVQEVQCNPMWTPAQFRTFRHLLDRAASPMISERAQGQVWMKRFKEKHGSVVCDLMLAEVRRLDEIEWLKNKIRGA